MKSPYNLGILVFSLCAMSLVRDAHAVDRNFNSIAVTNTTAETDIYNFTVPGGLLANSRGLRLLVWGTYRHNTGVGNRTVRVRAYYGGSLVSDGTSQAINSNATVGDVWLELVLFNTFATNAQKASARTIIQRLNNTTYYIYDIGAGTTDSTVDQTLRVTVTHSATGANTSFTKLRGHVMLL